MVGTFYRAPRPNAKPFVNTGAHVEEETVLCIIEAMKLMNEIRAEMRGVVKRILVENAQPVEYNQPCSSSNRVDEAAPTGGNS
jgi:acetyl-CoA carboxylase biotin carboxyl carrier protein